MYITTYAQGKGSKMENGKYGKTCKKRQKCLLNAMQSPKSPSGVTSEFAMMPAARTTWFEPSVLCDYTFLVIPIVIGF